MTSARVVGARGVTFGLEPLPRPLPEPTAPSLSPAAETPGRPRPAALPAIICLITKVLRKSRMCSGLDYHLWKDNRYFIIVAYFFGAYRPTPPLRYIGERELVSLVSACMNH